MFFPYKDDNPRILFPFVTYTIIGINSLVFIYQYFILPPESSDHIILSVPDVYVTIQEAIIAAHPEDTVEVGSGTYEESIHLLDKNLVLRSIDGPDSTLVEGDGTGSVLTIAGGQSNLTRVSGFTLTGGGGATGGGIRIDSSSSPVLQKLIIVDNDADEGAGVYIESSSPTLMNVSIQNNNATGDGGGMAIRDNSNPILNYIIITGNDGDNGAGIFVRDNSAPVFNNLTLADNEAGTDGDALYIRNGSNPQVTNSIFWNNGEESIYFSPSGSASAITLDYSILDGGESDIVTNDNGTVTWGTGNLEDDPLFANVYLLQWPSPAIDAGNPASDPDPDGTLTDMGANPYDQSYQPPDPVVDLSGSPGNGEVALS